LGRGDVRGDVHVYGPQVAELRTEYKKLKRAYTPLNLLMERARQIPLESVWPPSRVSVAPTPLQETLQQLVAAEVAKRLPKTS
jgi:hypothetical protein